MMTVILGDTGNTKQESGSLWTQRVQFGLLFLFPLSGNHSHYFFIEISKNNWWPLTVKVLTNQSPVSKLV